MDDEFRTYRVPQTAADETLKRLQHNGFSTEGHTAGGDLKLRCGDTRVWYDEAEESLTAYGDGSDELTGVLGMRPLEDQDRYGVV